MADIAWRIPKGQAGGGRFRRPSALERELGRDLLRNVWVGREPITGGGNYEPPDYIAYLVGSPLPYASHWIEEGWRRDDRVASGEVRINYAEPTDARFLEAAQEQVGGYITTDLADEWAGVRLEDRMARYAAEAARAMRDRLNQITYSRAAYNPNTNRRWVRTHALYNSIQAQRIV